MKAEVNLQRLLYRCEKMTETSLQTDEDWKRLEAYVVHLEKLRLDVVQQSTQLSTTALDEYRRKIAHLRKFLQTEYLAKHPELAESVLGDHLLVPTAGRGTSEKPDETAIRQRSKAKAEEELRTDLLTDNATKRAALLGTKGTPRRASEGGEFAGDDSEFEARLASERKMQAAITDDMLEMARQLKDTTLLASSLIQDDNRTLDETMKVAEKNQSMLAKESERLRKHMEVYGSWWIWVTLLIVSVVYVQMILIIRLFPVME